MARVALVFVSISTLALLLVAGPGRSQPAGLVATVEAGVLRLTDTSGAPVERLAPGAYSISVTDRSEVHNVHLEGPGVSQHTGLAFVGTTAWAVTLRDGVHTVVSDPQADQLALRLVVGDPPAPTLFASVTDSAIALRRADGSAVTQLDPGRYSIAVDDQSTAESFRLVGPGAGGHTQRHSASRTVWYLDLAEGVYSYFSDRRPTALRGTFRVGSAAAPAATRELHAITGPDFAIALVGSDFAPVGQLAPGTYSIAIDDLSPDHNFRLAGNGVDVGTSLADVGSRTVSVTLRAGDYAFLCTPHTLTMLGGITVRGSGGGSATARRLSATLTAAGTASLRDAAGRPVQRLAVGLYDLRVRDASRRVGFRLAGPGVTRSTGAAFTGTVTWRVRLARGTYRYGAGRTLRTLTVR